MSASKDQARRDAVESLVRDGINTARQFGNTKVTEEQVRREIGEIAEKSDRREDAKGSKNPHASR